MIGIKTKQPADRLDYPVDFSRWLPDGDVITTVNASVDKEDELVIVSAHVDTPIVTFWIEGGVSGTTYTVTVLVSTHDGRIKETEFKIRVRDC